MIKVLESRNKRFELREKEYHCLVFRFVHFFLSLSRLSCNAIKQAGYQIDSFVIADLMFPLN